MESIIEAEGHIHCLIGTTDPMKRAAFVKMKARAKLFEGQVAANTKQTVLPRNSVIRNYRLVTPAAGGLNIAAMKGGGKGIFAAKAPAPVLPAVFPKPPPPAFFPPPPALNLGGGGASSSSAFPPKAAPPLIPAGTTKDLTSNITADVVLLMLKC